MPVRHEILPRLGTLGFHAMQQAVDQPDFGGDLPQRVAHLGKADDAVCLGDAVGVGLQRFRNVVDLGADAFAEIGELG